MYSGQVEEKSFTLFCLRSYFSNLNAKIFITKLVITKLEIGEFEIEK